ncbi:MFS transporter [Butyrivibrio sp. FCS014]|uniref:MFS transporter n=1 Tax=Butyrivibrio sp. FCS014 TaxID=1408304 RepID=UPI00046403E7|nr:glycoside-pentoside-hexuronide (GPH):cation symporter [Butyrivibrio sp. FCS014]
MDNEKKYLSLGKKIAYGSGDFGSNFFYMLVSSFVLIYMTNTIGMNPGIVGTLIMVSKLLDGITDVFFGSLIDKTRSSMGKARPWMFFSGFPLALCMIMIFAVPTSLGDTAKYAWFFIFYTCANALFYTANNIAYATMSALITRNESERVSLGSFRYIFAMLASIIVSSSAVAIANALGGGVAGWRAMAIVFAVIYLIFNSVASLVCKEIPDIAVEKGKETEKESFWLLLKTVVTNRYYLLLLGLYLFLYINTSLGTSIGVFYFQYIMGDPGLLGTVSAASLFMIIGFVLNPMLVKKYGMYKVNLISFIASTIVSVVLLFFVYTANLGAIIVLSVLKAITLAFLMGSLNALVACVSQNSYLKTGLHTEGMMFSCSSIGVKVGGGLGAALSGWLLSAVGFVGTAEVQTVAVNNMIKFIYGGIPLILTIAMTLILAAMNVEKDNNRLEERNEKKAV